MAPPTLQQLAMRAAIRNKKDINDVSGVNYRIIRPFLMKIDNPQQLHRLEESEPSICGETAELWRALILRDCPSWETNRIEPKNPKNWFKVYNRVIIAEQERINEHGNALQRAIKQAEREKEQNFTELGSARSLPKGKVTSAVPAKRQSSSLGPFGRMPKGKEFSGRSILEKARREARESNALQRRAVVQQRTSTPTAAQQVAPSFTDYKPAKRRLLAIETSGAHRSVAVNNPTLYSGNPLSTSTHVGARPVPAPPVTVRQRPAANIFMSNPRKRKI